MKLSQNPRATQKESETAELPAWCYSDNGNSDNPIHTPGIRTLLVTSTDPNLMCAHAQWHHAITRRHLQSSRIWKFEVNEGVSTTYSELIV